MCGIYKGGGGEGENMVNIIIPYNYTNSVYIYVMWESVWLYTLPHAMLASYWISHWPTQPDSVPLSCLQSSWSGVKLHAPNMRTPSVGYFLLVFTVCHAWYTLDNMLHCCIYSGASRHTLETPDLRGRGGFVLKSTFGQKCLYFGVTLIEIPLSLQLYYCLLLTFFSSM